MAHYVLDSYALLAYFRNEKGGEKVEQLLNEAAADKHELYLTCINAGEVYYMSSRKDGAAKAELVWKAMRQFPVRIIDADLEFTFIAAKLKAKYSVSYADAFAAALTIKRKATLITGDDEFDVLNGERDFKVKYL
ncbi:type II toxin-antitoxin system VapC family toxin [Parafilimonas sp.]|uniref:type II toxin-antitoxin system VapC family toxin n=1 Tax=Parafilimonas sp. TaxID=1969739 RepID=UPI0039E250CC